MNKLFLLPLSIHSMMGMSQQYMARSVDASQDKQTVRILSLERMVQQLTENNSHLVTIFNELKFFRTSFCTIEKKLDTNESTAKTIYQALQELKEGQRRLFINQKNIYDKGELIAKQCTMNQEGIKDIQKILYNFIKDYLCRIEKNNWDILSERECLQVDLGLQQEGIEKLQEQVSLLRKEVITIKNEFNVPHITEKLENLSQSVSRMDRIISSEDNVSFDISSRKSTAHSVVHLLYKNKSTLNSPSLSDTNDD